MGGWSSGRLRCQGKAVARTSFHFHGRKEGIGRHGLIRTVTLENRCRARVIMGVLGSGVSRGGHGHGPGNGRLGDEDISPGKFGREQLCRIGGNGLGSSTHNNFTRSSCRWAQEGTAARDCALHVMLVASSISSTSSVSSSYRQWL